MMNSLDLIQLPHWLKNQPNHRDNLIGANNDQQALAIFLYKSGARSSETKRRYQRELIRFSVFLYKVMKVDYSSVRLTHLQAYLHFIQNLPDSWLKPGLIESNPNKILFKRSISAGKSTDQVIDVLSTFFHFLQQSTYLVGNPTIALVRTGEKQARGKQQIRFFSNKQWQHICYCLKNMPRLTQSQINEANRSHYIMQLAYGLALRESELADHSCDDIIIDNDEDYWISIVGKGKKRRNVPINKTLINHMLNYKQLFGYTKVEGDQFPLAPRLSKNKNTALSARGLRYWWQKFMQYCSQNKSDQLSDQFIELPFHTIRHTALSHLANNMDIEDLAIFAGHDSIQTTSKYYHIEDSKLKSLTNRHALSIKNDMN